MLIAGIVIVCVFIIFLLTAFFVTRKNIVIEVEGQKFRIKNQGSKLTIYVDENLKVSDSMPQLIYGESYEVKFDDKEYVVKCRSNSIGSVLRVEVYKDGKMIADNGKVLKEKKAK